MTNKKVNPYPWQNRDKKHRRVTHPTDPTPANLMTQQQFKDECDINRIVKNAERGVPPRFMARGEPQYGDFSNVPDLTTAHQLIQDAHSAFMNLPSRLRLELNNDPANIAHLTKDQIERYGLGNTPTQPADPAPKAGQAAPAGTEPAAPPSSVKKGKKDEASES